MRLIAGEGAGALVYMRAHEGRGAGLAAKTNAIGLQHRDALNTVEVYSQLGLPLDGRR